MEAVIPKVSTQFEFPKIPCSIPFECHPNFSSQAKVVDKWAMKTLGISVEEEQKKVIQARLGLIVPMVTPRGEDERIILSSQHVWVFFVLDDLLECEDEHLMKSRKAKVMQVASGMYGGNVQVEENAGVWSLLDETFSKMREQMSPSLFSRYMVHLSKYMDGVEKEVQFHKANRIMDEATYRICRRETSYSEACGRLFGEFCMDIQLREEVLDSPELKEFVEAVVDHTCLVNDLFSFRAEWYQKRTHNWVVVLLCHGAGIQNLQQAVDKVYEMIQEEENNITRLQKVLVDKAIATNDDHLHKFATTYPMVASGNIHWSSVTGRYHGYDNPLITGDEPFHGTVLMHPDATIVLPRKCQPHPFLLAS